MISNIEKMIFLCPCRDGSKTKGFSKGSHWGVDFGWTEDKNCDILAIQDGKVVDNFYSDSCGYSVVLQHEYDDGTHRWSAYIHLNSRSNRVIGSSVLQGEKIGVKGNTGNSNGYHLHIGISDTTTSVYEWNRMKSLCNFDPEPHFYKWKHVEYIGQWYESIPYIEDYQIQYPSPVERNSEVKQVEVLIDYLFLRDEPSGKAYGKFATMGIYDVLAEQVSSNYNWYKIKDKFWIASGGTRTRDLLPDKSKEQLLQEEVDKLNAEITALKDTLEYTKTSLETAESKIVSIKKLIDD